MQEEAESIGTGLVTAASDQCSDSTVPATAVASGGAGTGVSG